MKFLGKNGNVRRSFAFFSPFFFFFFSLLFSSPFSSRRNINLTWKGRVFFNSTRLNVSFAKRAKFLSSFASSFISQRERNSRKFYTEIIKLAPGSSYIVDLIRRGARALALWLNERWTSSQRAHTFSPFHLSFPLSDKYPLRSLISRLFPTLFDSTTFFHSAVVQSFQTAA